MRLFITCGLCSVSVFVAGAENNAGVMTALLRTGAKQLLIELHSASAADFLRTAGAAGYFPWRSESAEVARNSIHYLLKQH